MEKLMLFNVILVVFIVLGLILVKKLAKSERAQNIIFFGAAIFTILFHYSAFLYNVFGSGSAIEYLRNGASNLILPIYPCNVVMWSALIFALLKNKKSKVGAFFADFMFWFGIFSTLVGMFANMDFVKNPTLANFENVKSIVAHATLLFNVLLLPVFGYIKINVKRNMSNMVIAILIMGVIGVYCNLLFNVLSSEAAAYEINSMFLIHSPFKGLPFLKFPVIALIALPLYFITFVICDLFAHKKGERFYNKKK